MMNMTFKRMTIAVIVGLTGMTAAKADFTVPWYTIDGGGEMWTTGAHLELSGTIGQPDTDSNLTMTGSRLSLTGGFWSVTNVCACRGDMNGDGLKDARDIQEFLNCVITHEPCLCADMDGVGGVTIADVSVFVDQLLAGNGCP